MFKFANQTINTISLHLVDPQQELLSQLGKMVLLVAGVHCGLKTGVLHILVTLACATTINIQYNYWVPKPFSNIYVQRRVSYSVVRFPNV